MNPSEIGSLRERLTELAEAVGAKPPAEAGLKAWLAALHEFPTPDVLGALDDWLRSRPKMPAPSDIRARVIAMRDERKRFELRAQQTMIQTPGLGPWRGDPNGPEYAAFCEWFARFKSNPPACEHADYVDHFVRAGAVFVQADFRPGDFEALEERRAIQEESNGPIR